MILDFKKLYDVCVHLRDFQDDTGLELTFDRHYAIYWVRGGFQEFMDYFMFGFEDDNILLYRETGMEYSDEVITEHYLIPKKFLNMDKDQLFQECLNQYIKESKKYTDGLKKQLENLKYEEDRINRRREALLREISEREQDIDNED